MSKCGLGLIGFYGLLVASSLHAGEVTLDLDFSGTVSLSFTGDPPVAVALIVDTSSGAADIVGIANSAGIFNVNIDFAHTAETTSSGSYNIGDGHPAADPAGPGVATLPAQVVSISVAELDAADATSPVEVATISLDSFGGICISADELRGGIVDINGQPMTITNDGACFTIIGGGCGSSCCAGDIANSIATLGIPDGKLGFGDLNAYILALSPTFADIPSGSNPHLDCGDIADAIGTLGHPDGAVGFGDLNALITALAPTFIDRDCCTDPLF